jgi:hypothetical protein
VDQDGAYVLSDEWFNFVRKVDPVTGGVSIVLIAPGRLTNLVIDQDTGDYVIGVATSYGNQSSLLRADRSTGALATIATGLGQVTSIDFEPRSGDFVLGRLAPVSVLRVRRDGSTQALGGIPTDPMALKVDDETGNLLVGGWDVSTARITSLSPAGGVLTSHVLAPPFWIGGVEVYGSRKVFGSGSLTAGSAYAIDFAFPASPGAPYVAALSLALRPGIALRDGVRVVNLAPDPLFFRSLGGIPGITTGFSGTLDATGRARGTITLPPRFPTGIRLFVTAVAANPALPGGLDSGNSIGATSK